MIEDRYDVVVIGAGPAGSVAARFAAEKGASVLILERDREPGIPVRCAEGVSHDGIAPFIKIDKRWIATKIKTAGLHAPNGKKAVMYNNGDGYVLERRIFDTELCNIACQKGATLLTKADAVGLVWENSKIVGVKYRHLNQKKVVRCSLVIGADGVESQVGQWAGIDTSVKLRDIDTCVQYTLTNIEIEDTERCEFYFGTKIAPGGYIWIFPKSNNTANVGIGIAGNLAKEKGPKEYLDDFLNEYYPKASINYMVYGGVPTSETLNEIVKDNLMLVGDAARQVNPITGGGIVQGMIAGSIAGKVAAEAFQKKDFSKKFLNKYSKEWNKKLGYKQKTMYRMKDKFMGMDDNRFNNLVEICQKIPKDKFNLRILFQEVIKGDPKMMLEIAKAFVISNVKK